MRVHLFITCLADTLFPNIGQATVTVLERLGCEVIFPIDQTCCGQMHMNSGYPEEAGRLVRGFERTFAGADAVVTPSGSCAAMFRVHHDTVAPGSVMPPIYELSEFLIDVLGVEDVGAHFPHSVTYHTTCHSRRLLGLGDRPERLLKAVDGLTYIPLPDADRCCGFGGTFSMKMADVSGAMGADKVEHVRETGADYLCTVDSACSMNISSRAAKEHQPIKTISLAEILASR